MTTTTSQQYGSTYTQPGLISDRDQGTYGEIRGNLSNANDTVVRFLRERPAMALGCAVAVGFVVGRILTRK